MITDINSEDRLVQQTFADYLHDTLRGEELSYSLTGPYSLKARCRRFVAERDEADARLA
jgi:hypothetical protein